MQQICLEIAHSLYNKKKFSLSILILGGTSVVAAAVCYKIMETQKRGISYIDKLEGYRAIGYHREGT